MKLRRPSNRTESGFSLRWKRSQEVIPPFCYAELLPCYLPRYQSTDGVVNKVLTALVDPPTCTGSAALDERIRAALEAGKTASAFGSEVQTALQLTRCRAPSLELSISRQKVQVLFASCLIKYRFRLVVNATQ